MKRTVLVILVTLLLSACGSLPATRLAALSVASKFSDELECMSDCLDDSMGTCESCADRCLESRGSGFTTASN
jgi:hypothetical protein